MHIEKLVGQHNILCKLKMIYCKINEKCTCRYGNNDRCKALMHSCKKLTFLLYAVRVKKSIKTRV